MANPSKAHFEAFGALTHHYACVETGLKITLAGILNINLGLVLILAEPYSAVNLRKVIKSVAKMHEWKSGRLDQLMQIVGDLKVHGQLRNQIAHSRWTNGTRPNSIKPRNVDIRSESARFIGDDPEERDWTADEIQECAEQLIQLNARVVRFNHESGLTERIERNMQAASDAAE